jgi:hypothetical protein
MTPGMGFAFRRGRRRAGAVASVRHRIAAIPQLQPLFLGRLGARADPNGIDSPRMFPAGDLSDEAAATYAQVLRWRPGAFSGETHLARSATGSKSLSAGRNGGYIPSPHSSPVRLGQLHDHSYR